MSARRTVNRILRKTLFGSVFLRDAINECVMEDASKEDRAFIERLSKGVVERKVTLDAVLRQVSGIPANKIEPAVYCLLLAGIYEVLFMNTADYAAVNETVGLTGRPKGDRTRSFVNAVLRRVAREKDSISGGLSEREKLSLTPFLYDRLTSWYGPEETKRIAEWFLSRETDSLYVRRIVSKLSDEAFRERLKEEGVEAVPTGVSEDTYELRSDRSVFQTESFRSGLFYVQDLSSALAGDAVMDLLAPGTRNFAVFDACASPGGKILHLADAARKNSENRSCSGSFSFLAADVSEKKIEAIRSNQALLGFPEIETVVRDASVFDASFSERFDLVLLDAPCSGIGVIKRKPDIALRLDEKRISELVSLQRTMLSVNASYVKPGGTLFYSTCTIDPEENELAVASFLQKDRRFTLLSERLFLPGKEGTDGFYYARMVREP